VMDEIEAILQNRPAPLQRF